MPKCYYSKTHVKVNVPRGCLSAPSSGIKSIRCRATASPSSPERSHLPKPGDSGPRTAHPSPSPWPPPLLPVSDPDLWGLHRRGSPSVCPRCLLISLSIRARQGSELLPLQAESQCKRVDRANLRLSTTHRRALGLFHCSVAVSDAALNMSTEVSLRIPVFNFF